MKNWMIVIISGLLIGFIAKLWRERQSDIAAISFSPLRAILTAFTSRLGHRAEKRDDRLARLEEVLRAAEMTNNSFFRSIEMVQKNLESVIVRAENAEQRLHTILTQTELGKTDQYSSAALLLSEGKEPEQVARMLNLPMHQVQLVQELRQAVRRQPKGGMTSKAPTARRSEKKVAAAPTAKKHPLFAGPVSRRENAAAVREKDAVATR
jgi:hypothetical protein